jgi:hypothetical protein
MLEHPSTLTAAHEHHEGDHRPHDEPAGTPERGPQRADAVPRGHQRQRPPGRHPRRYLGGSPTDPHARSGRRAAGSCEPPVPGTTPLHDPVTNADLLGAASQAVALSETLATTTPNLLPTAVSKAGNSFDTSRVRGHQPPSKTLWAPRRWVETSRTSAVPGSYSRSPRRSQRPDSTSALPSPIRPNRDLPAPKTTSTPLLALRMPPVNPSYARK